MFSQCPQCHSVFQVSDAQLKIAAGEVRCGQCLNVFNALENQREDLLRKNKHSKKAEQKKVKAETSLETETVAGNRPGPASSEAIAEAVDALKTDFDKTSKIHSAIESESIRQKSPAPENKDITADTGQAMGDKQASSPASTATPDDTEQDTGPVEIPTVLLEDLQAEAVIRQQGSRLPWFFGNLFLIVALALQAVYFNRYELARNPQYQPWLASACSIAGCDLVQSQDIDQIEIISRGVHTHPSRPQALVAYTTITNNADFPQPYPLIILTFGDISGARLAQRRFLPEEYLKDTADLADGMAPNRTVRIELEMTDPGKEAVNFEFFTQADPRLHITNSL